MQFTDEQIIAVSRKYNLIPGSLKSKVFCLLDQGYSLREIRFLLRDYRNLESPKTFNNTLRRYAATWRELQGHLGPSQRDRLYRTVTSATRVRRGGS